MTRPLCSCHRVAMYRNNSDGGWRCAVKVRARQRIPNAAYARRRRNTEDAARLAALAQQHPTIWRIACG